MPSPKSQENSISRPPEIWPYSGRASAANRAAGEHAKALVRVEEQRRAMEPFAEAVAALRGYEAQRHEELKRVALADDSRPYRIGRRTIRAWDRVRDRWLGPDGATD